MSLHACTADITLLTAIPGSGKTLRMLQMMDAHIKDGDLVYSCNIEGICLPGVIPWEDPREWKNLPAGSILFVDEAQEFFRARRSGEPPKFITDMERIRHDAVRLVLSTQQPNYLDTHVRGLVGRHEHLVRKNGVEKSTIYRADMVMDNVRQLAGKKGLDKHEWSFPKEFYKFYKSAQLHTRKRQYPARLKAALGLLGIAALLVVGVVAAVGNDVSTGTTKSAARPQGAPLGATVGARLGGDEQILSAEQYAARLVPRIVSMPHSAPIFDGRSARSEPVIACMLSGAGRDAQGGTRRDSCTCLTEQGTRYKMEPTECALIARYGPPYNPFRDPPREQQRLGEVGGEGSEKTVEPFAASSGPVAQVNGYGDLGIALNPGP